MDESPKEPRRRYPAKGVHISMAGPNWIFLTVCTDNRKPWLAQSPIQDALHSVWKNDAKAWLVSDYLLMPDHMHLFCAPHDLRFSIERWMGFWKDRFSKTCIASRGKFQIGGFHHRLRTSESYAEKWAYVRENPVRAGLAENPDDWPYQGRVHDIRWTDG